MPTPNETKRKIKVMYLPTIDGRPARFDGDQLCFVDQKAGGFIAALLTSRTAVVRQIAQTKMFRAEFFGGDESHPSTYGWVRVEVEL